MELLSPELLREFAGIKPPDRERLARLWRSAAPYLDADFSLTKENLNQRTWEMYLAAALLANDFKLEPRSNQRKAGPDLVVHEGDGPCWIECIAPKSGEGADAVPRHEYSGKVVVHSVPDRELLLRYTSAIREKRQKREHYVKRGIISAADPFVIALSGSDLPNARTEDGIPRVLKILFGIGHYQVTFSTGPGVRVVGEGWGRRLQINKVSGTTVDSRIFLHGEYVGVSALMFSYADIVNYPPDDGADFLLVHNPMAAKPLRRGWLKRGREYWVEDDEVRHHDWNPPRDPGPLDTPVI